MAASILSKPPRFNHYQSTTLLSTYCSNSLVLCPNSANTIIQSCLAMVRTVTCAVIAAILSFQAWATTTNPCAENAEKWNSKNGDEMTKFACKPGSGNSCVCSTITCRVGFRAETTLNGNEVVCCPLDEIWLEDPESQQGACCKHSQHFSYDTSSHGGKCCEEDETFQEGICKKQETGEPLIEDPDVVDVLEVIRPLLTCITKWATTISNGEVSLGCDYVSPDPDEHQNSNQQPDNPTHVSQGSPKPSCKWIKSQRGSSTLLRQDFDKKVQVPHPNIGIGRHQNKTEDNYWYPMDTWLQFSNSADVEVYIDGKEVPDSGNKHFFIPTGAFRGFSFPLTTSSYNHKKGSDPHLTHKSRYSRKCSQGRE